MSDEFIRAQEQIYLKQLKQMNIGAIETLLPMWCRNIGENMSIAKDSPSVLELPPPKWDEAIVVGAAPSLKDEDLEKLRDFRGDIIVTNKTFKRLWDMGIRPEWMVLLDSQPVSVSQLRWVEDIDQDIRFWMREGPRVFVSAAVHPQTLRLLHRRMFRKYLFNPVELSNEVVMNCPKCDHAFEHVSTVRLSQAWEWMNGLQEFGHGGNVGTCAYLLARELKYKRIGIMGIDFYENLDPKWSLHEALEREILYYPDFGPIAFPTHFKAYFTYLVAAIEDTPADVRYLGTSPLFLHCPSPAIICESIDDFLEGK